MNPVDPVPSSLPPRTPRLILLGERLHIGRDPDRRGDAERLRGAEVEREAGEGRREALLGGGDRDAVGAVGVGLERRRLEGVADDRVAEVAGFRVF